MSKAIALLALFAVLALLLGCCLAVRWFVGLFYDFSRSGRTWRDLGAGRAWDWVCWNIKVIWLAFRKGYAAYGYKVTRCDPMGDGFYEAEIVGHGLERKGLKLVRWNMLVIALGGPEIGWTCVDSTGEVTPVPPGFVPMLQKAVIREQWISAERRDDYLSRSSRRPQKAA